MIKNDLDNSNNYLRLKNSQNTLYGFLHWVAYETPVLTVYLCI